MNSPLSPNGLALLDRRAFLRNIGSVVGGFSLLQLLERDGLLAAERPRPFRPAIDLTRPCAARRRATPGEGGADAHHLLRGRGQPRGHVGLQA